MLTLAEFRTLANATGIPAVWEQAQAPNQTAAIGKAIVQSTSKAAEPIVNAYGVNGKSIQVAAADLPTAPLKFDAFVVQGNRYVIDTVIEHKERGTGAVIHYTCYSRGR